jgi:Uma2 family endonuclease
MDPYLEAHWGDVHTRLMVYASNQLNAELPDDLQARVEESLEVMADDESSRTVYPDARVVEDAGAPVDDRATASAMLAVAEPYVVTLEDEPQTLRHLEIVDTSDGGRVVTAIEILSPENKVGSTGQLKYIRKQREYIDAGINLVEIDLIRAGNFVLAIPEDRLPSVCRTPFLICIRRATRRGQAELYPVPLRQALPNVPIPLRPTDKDVVLRLQPLLDDCYRDGRYHRINYRADPVPRLGEADARWTESILREKGLR